jgi:hypothetical protein
MLGRLFPRSFDNNYRGHWLAMACLGFVAFAKAAQGLESLLNTSETMVRADGIPLASYGAGAAETAVEMFALLGMYLLVVPLLSLVALIRYRTTIPLMLLTLLLEQAGSRVVASIHSMSRSGGYGGHPIGFYVNLALLGLTLAGFALSLAQKPAAAEAA